MRVSSSAVAYSLLLPAVSACLHGHGDVFARLDYESTISENISARAMRSCLTTANRTAITNVRIFDGRAIQPPSTVIIEGDKISQICAIGQRCPAPTSFDAQGKTLLPGLIDSHAHPSNVTHLTNLTIFGVTTTVVAMCLTPELCASLRNHTGLTSLVLASFMATSPNSTHAGLVPPVFASSIINSTAEIPAWVAQQVAQGADFIKAINESPNPGLSQEEQNAVVAESHKAGKQVVLHTSSYSAYAEGLVAGADQIHHAPLDTPVDDALIDQFKAQGTVVCPTLTMMRAIVEAGTKGPNATFAAASESVARLYKAGVPILAGTDGNVQAGVPANVLFGSSMHDELQNYVDAGMTPVDALNSATIVPAKYFGLSDRGAIKEGMRADLLLVDGDPTAEIGVTRNIAGVWVGGIQFMG
ncbi:hypothetical protein GQ53DRAFT_748343 [Thozetella sp. PMI_491]|nr:hypothetical protein GQ53DRAFT_748343 [Thozetella sp. PMI_491]